MVLQKAINQGKITLINGVEMHKKHPKTFEIPSEQRKRDVVNGGGFVKIGFIDEQYPEQTERMWVKIPPQKYSDQIKGVLDNEPYLIDIDLGAPLTFHPDNILAI
jgi:hypothetical protein